MKCKETNPVVGCWSKLDGSFETVSIHYTYANNEQGNEIIKAVRYTTADGTPITIAIGETVTPGACVILPMVDCEVGSAVEQRTQVLTPASAIFDDTDIAAIFGDPAGNAASNPGVINDSNFLNNDSLLATYPLNSTDPEPWLKSFQINNFVEADPILSIDNVTIRIGGLTFTSNSGAGNGDHLVLLTANNVNLDLTSSLPGIPVGYLGDGFSHTPGDLNIAFNTLPTETQLKNENLLLSFVWDDGTVGLIVDGVEVIVEYTVDGTTSIEDRIATKDCNSDDILDVLEQIEINTSPVTTPTVLEIPGGIMLQGNGTTSPVPNLVKSFSITPISGSVFSLSLDNGGSFMTDIDAAISFGEGNSLDLDASNVVIQLTNSSERILVHWET